MTNTRGGNDDRLVAILLTLVVPGLGHFYLGQKDYAFYWILAIFIYYFSAFILTFFVVGILLFLLAPLVHLAAAWDVAFRT
jgi:hypothetical protein